MKEMDWATLAVETTSDLKIILKGEVLNDAEQRIGVTSVVYISEDTHQAKQVYETLVANDPDTYYMIYAVNKDVRLDQLSHYPSIAIHSEDLL